jgi:hypothetical protein
MPGATAAVQKPVCSYCFFTLCARYCRASCCKDLPVRELQKFLSRKRVSTFGALEKKDLVQLIHQWALDLDEAAGGMAGGEGEAGGAAQAGNEALYGGVSATGAGAFGVSGQSAAAGGGGADAADAAKDPLLKRPSAPYREQASARAQGQQGQGQGVYDILGIGDLRRLLAERRIRHTQCIEKAELVHLLHRCDEEGVGGQGRGGDGGVREGEGEGGGSEGTV